MRSRLLVLLATLVLAACGFQAPQARRTPPPRAPEPPLSSVSATLAIPADAIARAINRKTVVKIAELDDQEIDCKITRCQLDLVATRNGNASVTASGDRLALVLPFAIDARIRAHALFANLGATGTGTGTARATTQLTLTRNWQVAAHTTGDVKLEQSTIALGSIRLDLTKELNRNSAKLSRPLFITFDREIPRAVQLKPQLERLWGTAFRPIRIAKKPVAWLLLQPETIRFAQPVAGGNAIALALSVEGRARIVVSDTPPIVKPTPLPDLSPLDAPASTFRLFVPATLGYDDAARLAMEALRRKPVRLGGSMTLRFNRLAILPSGSDVVVETEFCVKQGWWDIFGWFDACGVGYLRGAPIYDAKSETIRIARLRYDVASENVFIGIARAFEGETLGRELEKRMVFAVGKDLAKLRESVRKALARGQGRDITIAADLRNFGTPTLGWDAHAFIAWFSAEGQVRAQFHLN